MYQSVASYKTKKISLTGLVSTVTRRLPIQDPLLITPLEILQVNSKLLTTSQANELETRITTYDFTYFFRKSIISLILAIFNTSPLSFPLLLLFFLRF